MRRVLTAFLLAIVVSTAGVTSTLAFLPTDGSAAMTQCDYLKAKYPNRSANWPGCNVVNTTSYHYTSTSYRPGTHLRSATTTGTGEDDSTSCTGIYAGDTICWGWQDHGFLDSWVIKIGAYIHYHRHEVGDTDQPTGNVFCTVASTWGLTADVTDCGMLFQTPYNRIYGVEFKTTTQSFGVLPVTSVTWRTWISCSRTNWTCTSPSVRTTA